MYIRISRIRRYNSKIREIIQRNVDRFNIKNAYTFHNGTK